MKKEIIQEFTLRISRANKTELVIILYDMVLTYLKDSLEEFDVKDFKQFKWNVDRAKECIDELLNSLNLSYELAGNLRGLYFFYKRELTTASIKQDREKVCSIMKLIQELKESYEKISSQDTSAPIMENTQTVYAGLTYGKNSLNIDLSNQSIDRGFRI